MAHQSVHVDPEQLEDFERKLLEFATVMDDEMKALGGKVNELGSKWRDKQFEQFKVEFQVTRQLLRTFAEEARNAAPELKRDAQRARDFQQSQL